MTTSESALDAWLPTAPGCVMPAGRMTLLEASIAACLAECAIAGQRIGIALRDQTQYLSAFKAILERDAVAVLLSSGTVLNDKTAQELKQRVIRADPYVLVVDAAHRPALSDLSDPGIGILEVAPTGPTWLRRPTGARPETSWPGAAMMVFTSGSTGLPKGVMISRASLDFVMDVHAQVLDWRAGDAYLAALPLTHVLGVVNLLSALKVGARCVISPSFMGTEQVIAACVKERISLLGLVPYYMSRLLKDPGVERLGCVRQVVVSSAPVIPPDVVELKRRLPDLNVLHTYGLTEAFRSTALSAEDVPERLPSIGRAVPGVEVQLRDEAGELVPGPEGEGIAWIRGPNVMQGYWGDPALTERVLQDGWFCTSDVLRRSADGYLTIVGRTSEFLNGGGEKLMAHHIEALISQSMPVTEVMVVGVETRQGFDHVVAVVVPRPGQSVALNDVKRACAKAVHSVFVPAELVLMEKLPRRENGKVDRAQVLRAARDRIDARQAPGRPA